MGSSPHTRGAHRLGSPPSQNHRIIPAYAGSTILYSFRIGPGPDHPRIRGEHIKVAAGWLGQAGSSPHTRGALRRRADEDERRRIIPAYAGSTRCLRLDNPSHLGSSPHTRGAPA